MTMQFTRWTYYAVSEKFVPKVSEKRYKVKIRRCMHSSELLFRELDQYQDQ